MDTDPSPLRRLLRDMGVSDDEIEAAGHQGAAALAALAANRAAFPGVRRYTPPEVWDAAGVSEEQARALWRAMGFPDPDDDERALTEADLTALRTASSLGAAGIVDPGTVVQLARVMSQALATIAAAQVEAVIFSGALASPVAAVASAEPDASGESGQDADQEAVFAGALELAREALPALDELLIYLYRRHLASANERVVFRSLGMPEGTPSLGVGFADLVDFTGTARSVDEEELITLVEGFAALAGVCVAEHGGRVVKMIGDEVMFTSDDATEAGAIALDLAERVEEAGLGAVRAGAAYGPVLLAQGDVFGPTVNLAARLVTAARPGTVLVDERLAEHVDGDDRFFAKSIRERKLKGIGRVPALVLRRAHPEQARQ